MIAFKVIVLVALIGALLLGTHLGATPAADN
jgi:hypothetical protein